MDMNSKCKWPSASNSSCLEEEERSSVSERRREGRYKTFDWAEFSHMRKKKETFSRQSGIEPEFVCGDSVPPAPASSPEEPVARSIEVVHTEMGQAAYFTKPTDSTLLMVRSSVVTGDQRLNAVDDGVDIFNDLSNAQMEAKKEVPPS